MGWSGTTERFRIDARGKTGPNILTQLRNDRDEPSPDDWDEILLDIVRGLNECLTRSGINKASGNIDFAGNKITGLHATTTTISDLADRDVVNVKLLKDNTTAFIDPSNVVQTAETPNLITLNFTTSAAFIDGESYEFKAKQTITAFANIVVGTGRTQKPLRARRANISFGNIVQDEIYRIVYDSSNGGFWDVRDYNDYVGLTSLQYALLLAAPITTHPQTKYIIVDAA